MLRSGPAPVLKPSARPVLVRGSRLGNGRALPARSPSNSGNPLRNLKTLRSVGPAAIWPAPVLSHGLRAGLPAGMIAAGQRSVGRHHSSIAWNQPSTFPEGYQGPRDEPIVVIIIQYICKNCQPYIVMMRHCSVQRLYIDSMRALRKCETGCTNCIGNVEVMHWKFIHVLVQ